MVSASATFTVGAGQQMQPSIAPSVGNNVNTNSSLNYPTYVPVSVPAPIPSKEAAITNVNMPQQVLPGASFSIIVSVTTYVAGTVNYTVTLQIPQLQLTQTSIPMTLSNNAVGTTTFNVSLPVTARGLTANGTVTGQLTLQDTTNQLTVDGVPINFTIGGAAIPTGIGVVPNPIQPVALGPVARPVIGAVPLGPGSMPFHGYQGYYDEGFADSNTHVCGPDTPQPCPGDMNDRRNTSGPTGGGNPFQLPTWAQLKDAFGYQGYVFGRGGGRQRHQWDFMPHALNPRRAYQGVLGVDYTLACPDGSTANGAGVCADGVKAVVSPISQPPAPVAAPVTSTPAATTPVATPVQPTDVTTGQPVATPVTPVVTPTVPVVTPVSTPVVTPTPTPVTTPTVTPQTNPPTLPTLLGVTPPVLPAYPTTGAGVGGYFQQVEPMIQTWEQQLMAAGRNMTPQQWQQLAAQFRQARQTAGKGWAWDATGRKFRPHSHAYVGHAYQGQLPPQQGAVILTTINGNTLHLDAHGFMPGEHLVLDLNIPMSRFSKSTQLIADMSGHLAHDYNLNKPPGKNYIAALRVTGTQSQRVGFKSVQI